MKQAGMYHTIIKIKKWIAEYTEENRDEITSILDYIPLFYSCDNPRDRKYVFHVLSHGFYSVDTGFIMPSTESCCGGQIKRDTYILTDLMHSSYKDGVEYDGDKYFHEFEYSGKYIGTTIEGGAIHELPLDYWTLL